MEYTENLEWGNFYHLYNRGINGCNLFIEERNYEYFLSLMEKHLEYVSVVYAWALMPNHVHLLINLTGFENLSGFKRKPPHQYLSNLFNAYTKSINKSYGRHGNLFERPFKRKLVDDREYLKQLILYIHNNPVHHGFCSHPLEYPWTSYLSMVKLKPDKEQNKEVLGWFDGDANFKYMHDGKPETECIEKWLNI